MQAIKNIKIFLEKEPHHLKGLLFLGNCLVNTGKILEGVEILKSNILLITDIEFKKHIYKLFLFYSNYLEVFNFDEYHENISHLTNKNKALVQENSKLEAINKTLIEEIKSLKGLLLSCEQDNEDNNETFMECNL
jgi:hypothetical protein